MSRISPDACRDRPPDESRPRFVEEDLSRLWYEGGFARRGLRTRCGRRVRVFYRGLPNGNRGPDYRGAVISLGRGQPRAGDIELHVRASQWRAHGHHHDPQYDAVILHVVWQDDDPNPTTLHNGRQVPVLALSGGSSPADGPDGVPGEPCRRGNDHVRLGDVLDRAGEDRFLAKAARMEGDMAVLPAQEVLYQSLAEAMGYSRNKAPFRRLAASLPLAVLEGFLWGRAPERREAVAQALLLGAAGLLPSQRHLPAAEEWPGRLEQIWPSYSLVPELSVADWSLGVRPENHPVRRLAGLANLLAATLEDGLTAWALACVGTRDEEQGIRDKEPGIRNQERGTRGGVLFPLPYSLFRGTGEAGGSYWRTHFDFGLVGERLGAALVGKDRALEIAVNVLFPFAYAYGHWTGDDRLSHASRQDYALVPSPAANQVTRHMLLQLLGGTGDKAVAGTARRQQGLLHIFHSYCTRARCAECELSTPMVVTKT